jgi:hypothetical protein
MLLQSFGVRARARALHGLTDLRTWSASDPFLWGCEICGLRSANASNPELIEGSVMNIYSGRQQPSLQNV